MLIAITVVLHPKTRLMIFRLQSVFILLIFTLGFLGTYWADQTFWFSLFLGQALGSLAVLLVYKRMHIQALLLRILFLVSLVSISGYFLWLGNFPNKISLEFILSAAQFLSMLVALRFIKRDQQLLRNANRLR